MLRMKELLPLGVWSALGSEEGRDALKVVAYLPVRPHIPIRCPADIDKETSFSTDGDLRLSLLADSVHFTVKKLTHKLP
jgi:hypothetical protein